MFRLLFLVFLVVPLIEIYLLIKIGGVIGAFPTVFLVVFTAVLGAFLLRLQGFATVSRIQAVFAQGQLPAVELVEGALLLLSGALLLTPGFFTDTVGFLCLVPSVRGIVARWLLQRAIRIPGHDASGKESSRTVYGDRKSRTIEGEFRKDD